MPRCSHERTSEQGAWTIFQVRCDEEQQHKIPDTDHLADTFELTLDHVAEVWENPSIDIVLVCRRIASTQPIAAQVDGHSDMRLLVWILPIRIALLKLPRLPAFENCRTPYLIVRPLQPMLCREPVKHWGSPELVITIALVANKPSLLPNVVPRRTIQRQSQCVHFAPLRF